MAKKPASFKLTTKKDSNVIIIYTNVEQTTTEKNLVEFYLKQGYTPLFEEKKKGITVNEMRENLSADKESLDKFNALYKEKGGFHKACKFYNEWQKTNK